MAESRKLADARSILAIRRLQAARALMDLQEAAGESRSAEEAEAGARRQLRAASEQWQDYLADGVFRPDFAGALAGMILAAEAGAEDAARTRIASQARTDAARRAHAQARSAEEGAGELLRRAGRQSGRQQEARDQMRLEEATGLKRRPAS